MSSFLTGTVLGEDGVSEEAGRAEVTGGAGRVVDALEAVARDAVAGARVVHVDVTRAVARLAVIAYNHKCISLQTTSEMCVLYCGRLKAPLSLKYLT